jgi:hypothetical protein
MIAKPRSLANENTQLANGQSSLIPITCGCRGNVFQASVDHQISRDDIFSSVHSRKLQSLRNYQLCKKPIQSRYVMLFYNKITKLFQKHNIPIISLRHIHCLEVLDELRNLKSV